MAWWKKFFGSSEQHPNGNTANNPPPLKEIHPFNDEDDPLYEEAIQFVMKAKRASISLLQRQLQIGYNRAALMIETMELDGIVSSVNADGARSVLTTDIHSIARARQSSIEQVKQELEMRTNYLQEKYQDEAIVQRMMDKTVWEGMTAAQLFDTFGEPEGIDQKYLKKVSREVWKYNRQGQNRYASKITLENGAVVGWDFKDEQ